DAVQVRGRLSRPERRRAYDARRCPAGGRRLHEEPLRRRQVDPTPDRHTAERRGHLSGQLLLLLERGHLRRRHRRRLQRRQQAREIIPTAATPGARRLIAVATVAACALGGCGATLPYDVGDYETRCTRLNLEPIPPHEDDRHHGFKNVYACNVDRERLRANRRPFPEGTLIVKESRRPNESFVWLIALARKHGGVW